MAGKKSKNPKTPEELVNDKRSIVYWKKFLIDTPSKVEGAAVLTEKDVDGLKKSQLLQLAYDRGLTKWPYSTELKPESAQDASGEPIEMKDLDKGIPEKITFDLDLVENPEKKKKKHRRHRHDSDDMSDIGSNLGEMDLIQHGAGVPNRVEPMRQAQDIAITGRNHICINGVTIMGMKPGDVVQWATT